MFQVISERTSEVYYKGDYTDCEEFLHNAFDVADEMELTIEEC